MKLIVSQCLMEHVVFISKTVFMFAEGFLALGCLKNTGFDDQKGHGDLKVTQSQVSRRDCVMPFFFMVIIMVKPISLMRLNDYVRCEKADSTKKPSKKNVNLISLLWLCWNFAVLPFSHSSDLCHYGQKFEVLVFCCCCCCCSCYIRLQIITCTQPVQYQSAGSEKIKAFIG